MYEYVCIFGRIGTLRGCGVLACVAADFCYQRKDRSQESTKFTRDAFLAE